jgi:PEP-CTERM/exosortase A-associated glycosyltransferase
MKVLHILDHYKPHFSGYVFRTAYIMKHQKEFGIEPVILTSPKHGSADAPVEEIDNMTIYRTSENEFGNIPFIRERRLMKALQERMEQVVEIEKPDIIHAHSPSLNGIPAVRVGRKNGIPIVYEIRAFWEDAAVDHGSFNEGSLKYRISRFIETYLMKKVDDLFTICEGLRKEIASRGILSEKINVVPNCVNTEFFKPEEYYEELADKYGFRNKTVFGYIGSFYHYEGIDLLLDAYAKTLLQRRDTALFLIGDGPEKHALSQRAAKMGLLGHVIFTGKVPHDQIKKYYSVIDILVYARKKMRLTELVTPLKPLEAMAMGKIALGSDVGGIKELITQEKDGFLFRAGDLSDLYRSMIDLCLRNKNLDPIRHTAIETAHNKRQWSSSVKKYLPVYERLVAGSKAGTGKVQGL